jgi:hypothetical protein
MRPSQTTSRLLAASLGAAFLAAAFVSDRAEAQQQQQQPPQPMSFFVTSAGPGNGGNLGGLAGADKHCQTLANAAGGTKKTWRAYLSTQGPGAVNARDRIGKGPWFNAKGARIAQDVADLHGDSIEQARRGNNLTRVTAITEKGQPVNGVGDTPNVHDILTGSQLDGTAFPAGGDRTCQNWTSNTGDSAQVGHHDRTGGGNTSWNSTHQSKGCSQANLVATGGAGLLYCFAID